MRKLTFLTLLLLIIITPARADDYQLRPPSAEDYLRAIPLIFNAFYEGSPEHIAREYLMRLVYRELNERYPDFVSEDFTLVRDALIHLQLGFVGFSPIFGQDINTYNTLLIEALFLDEPIDLATVETIEVDPFRIDVTPIDLDGDDDTEFLLDIYTQDSHLFKIFDADDSQPSGYRMVETPPLWFSYDCSFRSVCGGNGTLFSTEDINADGLSELVFAVGSYCGYGECGGHLEMWAWRDGAMVSVRGGPRLGPWWTAPSGGGGPSPLLPPEGTWRFENIDGDEALEFIQRREFRDNRGCDVIRTTVFDWQVTQDQYVQGDVDTHYADTGACGLREGHEAFRNGDYLTAIDAYTQGVNLLSEDDQSESRQYAEVRLALAYALNGNRSEALLRITQLQQVESQTEVIRRFIDAFADYFEANDPVELCIEMRDAFADPRSSNVGASDVFTFGNLDNVSGRGSYVGGDFGPDATGCDLASFLQFRLSQIELTNTGNFLNDIQFNIGRISASLEFDFDQNNNNN